MATGPLVSRGERPATGELGELEQAFERGPHAAAVTSGPAQAPPPPRARGLQTPWTRDFHDLSFEWRRLFAEALGTFLLVLVAAGGTVVNARSHGQVPLDARWSPPGSWSWRSSTSWARSAGLTSTRRSPSRSPCAGTSLGNGCPAMWPPSSPVACSPPASCGPLR